MQVKQLLMFDSGDPLPEKPKPRIILSLEERKRKAKLRERARRMQRVLITATGRQKKTRVHKPLEDPIYSMNAGYVDEHFPEEHARIQQEINQRCQDLRDTWTPQHLEKARQYKVPGIVLVPSDSIQVPMREEFD
jgi:hypothetical protein